MINLKKVVSAAAIAGALGFAGLAVGPAIANADAGLPGIPWSQDDGWGHGHGHGHGGDWDDRGGWGGGGWGGGPGWGGGGPGWGGPGAFICATGPLGYVTGCI